MATTQYKHPLRKHKPNKKGYNENEAIADCVSYLRDLATNPCIGQNGVPTNCNCMASIVGDNNNEETIVAAAGYMLHFAALKYSERKMKLWEWHQNAKLNSERGRNYVLPCIPYAASEVHLICKGSLMKMFDVGKDQFSSALKNPTKKHGMIGKKNRQKDKEELHESLDEFFDRLLQEGLPFATQYVREKTGYVARDEDPDIVGLPPHYSKYKVYERWIFERGYIAVKASLAKSNYAPLSEFEPRPHDDEEEFPLWPSNQSPKTILSFTSFRDYWKEKYPKIVIRPRGEDICTDCLCLRYKLASFQPCLSDDEDESDNETDDHPEEGALQDAINHVKQYQKQHEARLYYIDILRNDLANLIPSNFRRRVLTIDMGQNLGLPHFAGEQPGDSYYYSPLTVYVFGVCEQLFLEKSEQMEAYISRECDGDRGANNIGSCLLKDFAKRGFFETPQFGELTLIADNCAGQNKNKDIIRLLMWLVEAGIFRRVRLVFLVKGHTKNCCDRLFNLLKVHYHSKNLYNYDDLIQVLKTCQEYISVNVLKHTDMKDLLSFQNRFYRTPTAPRFSKQHVFTFENSIVGGKPTVVIRQEVSGGEITTEDLLPTAQSELAREAFGMDKATRQRHIKGMLNELQVLPLKPFRTIKKIEIHCKFVKLLPNGVEDASKICDPQTEEEKKVFYESQKRKRQDKDEDREAKKRRKDERTSKAEEKRKTLIREAIVKLKEKYSNSVYPSVDELSPDIFQSDVWRAIDKICNFNAVRLDNKSGQARVVDIKATIVPK